MWQILTYTYTFLLLMYIIRVRSYEAFIVALFSAALWNVPLVILGNSSSAGIFPADVILLIAIGYFIFFEKIRFQWGNRRREVFALLALTLYAVIRTIWLFLFDDYGYYNNFIIYGAFRWVLFALAFIVFTERSFLPCDYKKIFSQINVILLIYMAMAVLHQQGIIDFSASKATGHAYIYERVWEVTSLFRTFCGSNSATVGCIGAFGVLLGLFQYKYLLRKKRSAFFLIILSAMVVIGSWSRSDVLGLLISLGAGTMIWWRKTFILAASKQISLFLIIVISCVFMLGLDDTIIKSKTIDRFFGTDYVGEYSGRAEGTGAYRSKHHDLAVKFWQENPENALFGFGPNGYRMLPINGIGHMNFGHNIYYHFIGELGLLGLSFFTFYLIAVIRNLIVMYSANSMLSKDISFFIGIFLFQRLLAGVAVDTVFAVDNMLPTTIIFLFVVGIWGGYTPYKFVSPVKIGFLQRR